MQYLTRRLLSLSTAGAVSLYIWHNRDKKRSTVFAFGDTQQNATPILDDDIRTTRTHRADTSTDKVTFSLITRSDKPDVLPLVPVPDKPDVPPLVPDKPEVLPLVPDVSANMDTFSLIDDVYHEPFDNGLVLRQVNYDKPFLMTYVPYSRVNHVVKHIKGGPRPESHVEQDEFFEGGCQAGVMVALGRDQMYMLGRRMRSLYIDKLRFLDNTFNPEQIQIRSTNYNRCIESMECVIAGLYGQNSFSKEDPLVIPVSREQDEVLVPNIAHCPALRSIVREGELYLASLPDFQNVMQEISNRLDIQLNPKEVDMITWRDNIFVRQALGLPVPETLLEILPQIDSLGTQALEIFVYGPPKHSDFPLRVSGIPMRKLIEKNISDACCDCASSPKLQLYACHDSSIALLLSMFGCFDHRWPPYSADMRLELYEAPGCEDRYWVKILYCDKVVVLHDVNSEKFPYICTKLFHEKLKRFKLTCDEQYRINNCSMYNNM